MDIQELLKHTVEKGASDLHISTGMPPAIRINGDLHYLDEKVVSIEQAKKFIQNIMTSDQLEQFEKELEDDFAYSLPDNSYRFRVNAYHQQRGISLVFRAISTDIPSLEDLDLPKAVKNFCNLPNGLVLVTGPTGSGKSTTLASMIHHINNTKPLHIITIEDPIEYIHTPNKCLIDQREVGRNTHNFQNALRATLREDPDIILVGEMRDIETIRLALTAAETGILIFATLHTNSAPKTIDRIIDAFPGNEKEMVRSMLSQSLRGIVAQTLIKRVDGGRVAACEILVSTSAIRNLIREHKIPQIYSAMQSGQAYGMQTLESHLQMLAEKNIIDLKTKK